MSYKPPKSMIVNNGDKTGVVLDLSSGLFRRLDEYAKLANMARVDVVRRALEIFLEEHDL